MVTEVEDLARTFLDAFSEIEKYVRGARGAREHEPFVGVVERLAPHDRLVRQHIVALKAFASLRNAIQHDKYRSGLPIATPHMDVVEAITAVRDQLLSPQRIDAFVQGRGPVESVDAGAGVWTALRAMSQRDFSQVLVYDGTEYAGLLTTNAVSRWLASEVEPGGALLVEEVLVRDALEWAEPHEVAAFIARTTTVAEVVDRLSPGVGDGAPLSVVVTESGAASQKPLGIVVAHDLPELISQITVSF